MTVTCACIFDFTINARDEEKIKKIAKDYNISKAEAVRYLYRNNQLTLMADGKIEPDDMSIDEILEVW